ncbi:hypothetical protein [Streptomyces sp. NPDC056632]|uniref:hypothetical protein n=1 Tax=Streptomyces sp. NPDC056632 TaxID=3345884 RepID=UPI00367805E6
MPAIFQAARDQLILGNRPQPLDIGVAAGVTDMGRPSEQAAVEALLTVTGLDGTQNSDGFFGRLRRFFATEAQWSRPTGDEVDPGKLFQELFGSVKPSGGQRAVAAEWLAKDPRTLLGLGQGTAATAPLLLNASDTGHGDAAVALARDNWLRDSHVPVEAIAADVYWADAADADRQFVAGVLEMLGSLGPDPMLPGATTDQMRGVIELYLADQVANRVPDWTAYAERIFGPGQQPALYHRVRGWVVGLDLALRVPLEGGAVWEMRTAAVELATVGLLEGRPIDARAIAREVFLVDQETEHQLWLVARWLDQYGLPEEPSEDGGDDWMDLDDVVSSDVDESGTDEEAVTEAGVSAAGGLTGTPGASALEHLRARVEELMELYPVRPLTREEVLARDPRGWPLGDLEAGLLPAIAVHAERQVLEGRSLSDVLRDLVVPVEVEDPEGWLHRVMLEHAPEYRGHFDGALTDVLKNGTLSQDEVRSRLLDLTRRAGLHADTADVWIRHYREVIVLRGGLGDLDEATLLGWLSQAGVLLTSHVGGQVDVERSPSVGLLYEERRLRVARALRAGGQDAGREEALRIGRELRRPRDGRRGAGGVDESARAPQEQEDEDDTYVGQSTYAESSRRREQRHEAETEAVPDEQQLLERGVEVWNEDGTLTEEAAANLRPAALGRARADQQRLGKADLDALVTTLFLGENQAAGRKTLRQWLDAEGIKILTPEEVPVAKALAKRRERRRAPKMAEIIEELHPLFPPTDESQGWITGYWEAAGLTKRKGAITEQMMVAIAAQMQLGSGSPQLRNIATGLLSRNRHDAYLRARIRAWRDATVYLDSVEGPDSPYTVYVNETVTYARSIQQADGTVDIARVASWRFKKDVASAEERAAVRYWLGQHGMHRVVDPVLDENAVAVKIFMETSSGLAAAIARLDDSGPLIQPRPDANMTLAARAELMVRKSVQLMAIGDFTERKVAAWVYGVEDSTARQRSLVRAVLTGVGLGQPTWRESTPQNLMPTIFATARSTLREGNLPGRRQIALSSGLTWASNDKVVRETVEAWLTVTGLNGELAPDSLIGRLRSHFVATVAMMTLAGRMDPKADPGELFQRVFGESEVTKTQRAVAAEWLDVEPRKLRVLGLWRWQRTRGRSPDVTDIAAEAFGVRTATPQQVRQVVDWLTEEGELTSSGGAAWSPNALPPGSQSRTDPTTLPQPRNDDPPARTRGDAVVVPYVGDYIPTELSPDAPDTAKADHAVALSINSWVREKRVDAWAVARALYTENLRSTDYAFTAGILELLGALGSQPMLNGATEDQMRGVIDLYRADRAANREADWSQYADRIFGPGMPRTVEHRVRGWVFGLRLALDEAPEGGAIRRMRDKSVDLATVAFSEGRQADVRAIARAVFRVRQETAQQVWLVTLWLEGHGPRQHPPQDGEDDSVDLDDSRLSDEDEGDFEEEVVMTGGVSASGPLDRSTDGSGGYIARLLANLGLGEPAEAYEDDSVSETDSDPEPQWGVERIEEGASVHEMLAWLGRQLDRFPEYLAAKGAWARAALEAAVEPGTTADDLAELTPEQRTELLQSLEAEGRMTQDQLGRLRRELHSLGRREHGSWFGLTRRVRDDIVDATMYESWRRGPLQSESLARRLVFTEALRATADNDEVWDLAELSLGLLAEEYPGWWRLATGQEQWELLLDVADTLLREDEDAARELIRSWALPVGAAGLDRFKVTVTDTLRPERARVLQFLNASQLAREVPRWNRHDPGPDATFVYGRWDEKKKRYRYDPGDPLPGRDQLTLYVDLHASEERFGAAVSEEEFGDRQGLAPVVAEHLVELLRAQPHFRAVMAYAEAEGVELHVLWIACRLGYVSVDPVHAASAVADAFAAPYMVHWASPYKLHVNSRGSIAVAAPTGTPDVFIPFRSWPEGRAPLFLDPVFTRGISLRASHDRSARFQVVPGPELREILDEFDGMQIVALDVPLDGSQAKVYEQDGEGRWSYTLRDMGRLGLELAEELDPDTVVVQLSDSAGILGPVEKWQGAGEQVGRAIGQGIGHIAEITDESSEESEYESDEQPLPTNPLPGLIPVRSEDTPTQILSDVAGFAVVGPNGELVWEKPDDDQPPRRTVVRPPEELDNPRWEPWTVATPRDLPLLGNGPLGALQAGHPEAALPTQPAGHPAAFLPLSYISRILSAIGSPEEQNALLEELSDLVPWDTGRRDALGAGEPDQDPVEFEAEQRVMYALYVDRDSDRNTAAELARHIAALRAAASATT